MASENGSSAALEPVAETEGSLPWDDAVVGVSFLVTSLFFIGCYIPTIMAIVRDKELMTHCSYRLIVHLGVADIFQCGIHTASGIMTLVQSVGSPWFNAIVGAPGYTMWFCYSMFTNILAFNRFFEMGFPLHAKKLFSPKRTTIWIVIGYLSGVPWLIAVLATGPVFVYLRGNYAWFYNGVGIANTLQTVNTMYNIVILSMTVFWYLLLIFKLHVIKSNLSAQAQESSNSKEKAVLITSACICGMLSLPCIVWPLWPYFLPPSKWTFFLLDQIWVLNSGMNPIIYFTVNKTIQKRVKALFKKPTEGGDITKTNAPTTNNNVKNRIRGTQFSTSTKVVPVSKPIPCDQEAK